LYNVASTIRPALIPGRFCGEMDVSRHDSAAMPPG